MTDPLAVAHSHEVIIRGIATRLLEHERPEVRHDARLMIRECEALHDTLKKLNDPNAHLGAVEGERKENDNVSE